MASANTSLRITELDFHSIRQNLKTYLENQAEFTDYDFDGSGLSILLDILAYNTHYMSYYLNVVGNEMFLDTAQIRNSVISHAKMIGYVPESRKGALAKVNIVVTPSAGENQNTTTLTLDKYTRFLAQDRDGENYQFVTLYSNTVSKSGGSFTFSNVFLKQGETVTLQYRMDSTNTKRRFDIPSANVDLDTLTVTVQESATNTDITNYTKGEDITEIKANSPVYFIEENQDSNYTLYFGDDVIGKKPANGNIIICTYLDTVGVPANNISDIYLSDVIGGEFSDNVSITVIGSTYGGTEKETIEQVRFRAPHHYTVQNRAVTETDYESLILQDYTNIDAVSVWGGEENDPVVYGKVYLSLKTKENYVLTNLEKDYIKKSLIRNRNLLTVIPEIIDPDYVYLLISGKVYYDSKLTSRTSKEIEQLVKAAIEDYSDDELTGFKSVFRKSKLQKYIENSEKSITGSDIDIYIQKRLTVELNEADNYIIKFNSPLRKGDFSEKLYSFPEVNVRDSENIERKIFFEEVPEAFTGIDSISITNPGHDYETTPTITITGDGTGATAQAYIVNGKIDRIEIVERGSNYTRATVAITGGKGSEGAATPVLENNNGTLRTFYYKSNGEKVIVNDNAGNIFYTEGKIEIIDFLPLSVVENDFYSENVLTINAPIDEENLYPLRNRIVAIDSSDASSIQIEAIAES